MNHRIDTFGRAKAISIVAVSRARAFEIEIFTLTVILLALLGAAGPHVT